MLVLFLSTFKYIFPYFLSLNNECASELRNAPSALGIFWALLMSGWARHIVSATPHHALHSTIDSPFRSTTRPSIWSLGLPFDGESPTGATVANQFIHASVATTKFLGPRPHNKGRQRRFTTTTLHQWRRPHTTTTTTATGSEVFIVPHRFLQDSWGFLRIPEDSQDSILSDVPANLLSPVGVYSWGLETVLRIFRQD